MICQLDQLEQLWLDYCTTNYNIGLYFVLCLSVFLFIMGNWVGSLWPDKPADIEQPKIFGNLPKPYSIDYIKPTLDVYTNVGGLVCLTINHVDSPQVSINKLEEKNCLQNCDRLIVITHGFLSHGNLPWLHEMKDTILSLNQGQLVAILDWGDGSDIGIFRYSQAASNCLHVGSWLGDILKEFHSRFPTIKIYCIGHSLGSHLMGVAGRTSKSLKRITGLDPAGVGFQNENTDKRLNPNDADLVDVIHTDGNDVPYFGTLVPLGKIDFYPNYGWNQPTTDDNSSSKPTIRMDQFQKKIAEASPYGGNITESHGRALDYFLWSINNQSAFRTHLKLDGIPDMNKPVHRLVATDFEHNIEAEMGYHCDTYLEIMTKKTFCLQNTDNEDGGKNNSKPVQFDNKKFFGCYYVHTNVSPPWC